MFKALVDDPELYARYFKPLESSVLAIPYEFKQEFLDILKIPVTLVASIDNPDSYKTMNAALVLVQAHRDRMAEMIFHLRSLIFKFEKTKKQVTNYLERKHYSFLSGVKDSTRKTAISVALAPLDSALEELEHLKDLGTLTSKRLEDVNWTIKGSNDIVTEYFNNCKAFNHWQTTQV